MKHEVTAARAVAVGVVLLVLAMIGIYAATGVGQDGLQFSRAPAAYAAVLLRNPGALRLTVGLDNLFVVFYGTLFLLLGQRLLEQGAARALVFPAVALLLGWRCSTGWKTFTFSRCWWASAGRTLGSFRRSLCHSLPAATCPRATPDRAGTSRMA